MRLSAGAFAQLGEAASEFALSRMMGYASNLSGYYDQKFEPLVTVGVHRAGRRQAQGALRPDQRLPAGRRLLPGFSAYSNIMATSANVRGLRWEPSTAVTLREMWLA